MDGSDEEQALGAAGEPESDHRLVHIQSVTEAALSHLDLDQLLGALLIRIGNALGADTCAFLLLDERTNELVARAARGIEEEVEQGIRIPVGRGFAGRVAAERRPIVIEDVDHADVLNPILREKGIKSLLGTPLVVHGKVIGVLHVGTLTPRVFTAEDVELLELAADKAALAIEHGRVYEEARKTAERLAKLQAMTDAALSNLTVEALLEEIVERIRNAIDADTCAVLLLDERTNELVARAARGIEEEVEQGIRIPVGRGFAGRVAAERRPIVIEDVDHADVLNPILREKGIKSLLGTPLVVHGKVIGVLHVGTLTPRVFTAEDVELLELAGQRVAAGLERALVHEQLIRLDRMRHSFITIASHELRTPMAAVVGAALTLKAQAEHLSPEDEWQLKEMLAEQAGRMTRLIDQLLDVSRLENEAVEIRPACFRLAGFLESTVEAIVGDSGVEVEVDVPVELELNADPHALERVISNLVTNALRHGAPPIVVSAQEEDGHIRVIVADSGPGVLEDVQERIFEQFVRGSNAAGEQGSGLGLAIAKSYARAHGGDLVYRSDAPGARFELIMPIT